MFKIMPNPFDLFGLSWDYGKNVTVRTFIVLFTGLLAIIVPKFGLFINFTGAFACTALAFVLPLLMYNKCY